MTVLRPFGRLLAVVGFVFMVFAPATAAFAQTDYPTTPTTDPCQAHPCQVVTAPPAAHATSSTSTGSALAFTGGNIALLVGVGLAAALGGLVLVRLSRRSAATS